MTIVYDQGPETIKAGIAGTFKRGIPREVDSEIAEKLLKKESIKFREVSDDRINEETL